MWLKAVDGVLKGAPFDRLVGKTADGLSIEPIYTRAANAAPIVGRGPATPWPLVQRVDHPNPADANKQALEDLENGATGLTLVFAGANGAHGFGLPPTREAVERALKDVLSRRRHCHRLPDRTAIPSKRHFISPLYWPRKASSPKPAICVQSRSDRCGRSVGIKSICMVGYCAGAGRRGVAGRVAGVQRSDRGCRWPCRATPAAPNPRNWPSCWALRSRTCARWNTSGMDLGQARDLIYARLSADADQFMTMAKFRALRKLWARVQQACGLEPKPIFIAADTAYRMLSRRDSDVNMLRMTMATLPRPCRRQQHHCAAAHLLRSASPMHPRAARAQHPTDPSRGIEPGEGVADPAAGTGEHRNPDRRTLLPRLGAVPGDRAGRWHAGPLSNGERCSEASRPGSQRPRESAWRSGRTPSPGSSEFANLGEKVPVCSISPPR